jgi:hypothetical protein
VSDDLSAFADHPVVQALRAPAQPHELAGEQVAAELFRTSMTPPPRRRRAIPRMAVGGAGVVLGLALTAGVAAAYTGNLPDPLQNAVSSAIAPLGLPAPPAHHRRRAALRQHLGIAPGGGPARPRTAGTPAPSQKPSTPAPAASTGAAPSAQPSLSAAPPVRPVLSASVSRHVVAVHGQVVLTGRLTQDGAAVADKTVYAAELPAGASTWHRVASAVTGSDGSVSIAVTALTSNVRLRLASDHVVSSALRVSVVPTLTASGTRSGRQRVETVTVDGAREGDSVVLQRRDGDTWTKIDRAALDTQQATTFTVPGPSSARVRYRVWLPATAYHAASFVLFVVPAR